MTPIKSDRISSDRRRRCRGSQVCFPFVLSCGHETAVTFVLLLTDHLFNGMNETLRIFGGYDHIPFSVVTAYHHHTIPIPASGEHHTGSQKRTVIRVGVATSISPGNVVDEKGQETGLDGDRPIGSDIYLSGQDRHVEDHNDYEAPCQDPNGRGILVFLLALYVEQYYRH